MRARMSGERSSIARRIVAAAATSATALSLVVALPETDAGAAASTALVSGQALDSGRAVSGASVTLTAWPNSDTLGKLADGATVPLVTISSASTDASGNYALSPDLAGLSSMYQEFDGTINVQVDVSTATATQTVTLPAALASTSSATLDTTAVESIRSESVGFDLSTQTVAMSTNKATPQTMKVPVDGMRGRRERGHPELGRWVLCPLVGELPAPPRPGRSTPLARRHSRASTPTRPPRCRD
jgi:hypothetical protein